MKNEKRLRLCLLALMLMGCGKADQLGSRHLMNTPVDGGACLARRRVQYAGFA